VLEQGVPGYLLPEGRATKEPKVFLDISDRKPYSENEEGLLALAFHPQFKTNGLFYIYYSQQGTEARRGERNACFQNGSGQGRSGVRTDSDHHLAPVLEP